MGQRRKKKGEREKKGKEEKRERERLVSELTMFVKSAAPTPTITIDSGSLDAPTILSTVLCMSDMTPSCNQQQNITNHSNPCLVVVEVSSSQMNYSIIMLLCYTIMLQLYMYIDTRS